MGISPIWLVLFVLVSIIPSLVVAVYFISRFEALRGDVSKTAMEIGVKIGEFQLKLDAMTDSSNLAKHAHSTADKVECELINLKESFQALTNKWTARDKAEKRAEKVAQQRKEDEDDADTSFIPGTEQQMLPFPQYPLPQPQVKVNPVYRSKRKFGDIP